MKYLWEDVTGDVFQLAGMFLLPMAVGRLSGLWLVNFGRLSVVSPQRGGVGGGLKTDKPLFNASLPFKGSGFCMPPGSSGDGTFVKLGVGEG